MQACSPRASWWSRQCHRRAAAQQTATDRRRCAPKRPVRPCYAARCSRWPIGCARWASHCCMVVDTETKYRSAAPGFARELAERAGGRYYRLPGAEEGVFTDAVLRGRHARGDGERTGDGARRHRGRQAACARAAVMARLIKICCRMRPPTEHRARPLASRQVAPAHAARGPCPRPRAVGAGGAARWAARASHSLPRPPPSAPKQRYGPYVATPFPRARAQARGRAGAAGG